MIRNLSLPLAFAMLAAQPVCAQESVTLTWGDYSISSTAPAGRVSVEKQDGVETLVVDRARVALEGVEFSEGVIEFDLAFEDRMGFGGILWHTNGDDAEYFYIRQHKSGQPDAGQYTPIRGGLTSWQIYTDRNAIVPLGFTHEGPNHFRMIVQGDRAEIYVNGAATPQLHIPDLATDRGVGGIAFQASGPAGKIGISNLVIRPLAAGEGIVLGPATVPQPPSGVIEEWALSKPFPESQVEGLNLLPENLATMGGGNLLKVEHNGIADLSRKVLLGDEDDTVIVSTFIEAQGARRALLKFGYSDRLRLYLNGELIFAGTAGWRSRDHFFLGTVGFLDAVTLPLQSGPNRLEAVVSETFGGWAFAAAIEDREGLTISARASD